MGKSSVKIILIMIVIMVVIIDENFQVCLGENEDHKGGTDSIFLKVKIQCSHSCVRRRCKALINDVGYEICVLNCFLLCSYIP